MEESLIHDNLGCECILDSISFLFELVESVLEVLVEGFDFPEFSVAFLEFFEGGDLSVENIISEFAGSVGEFDIGSLAVFFGGEVGEFFRGLGLVCSSAFQ